MAEGYFRNLLEKKGILDVKVSSAGTFAGSGESPSPNSVSVLKEYGIDISDQQSTPLTRQSIEDADLIIAMTDSHRMHIGQIDPSALEKTRLLAEYSSEGEDIADPFGGNTEVYNFCFSTMKPALEKLLEEVIKTAET